MNKTIRVWTMAAAVLLAGAAVAIAQTFGTAAEAKAMLEKAAAALKADEAKAVADFNIKDGPFRDRDLYVFCTT